MSAAAAGLVLAIGCSSQSVNKGREEVRQRWAASRAGMATKLAEGCYQRGEFGRASEHIAELVRANEPYAPMYVLAARLAAEKGDLDAARAFAANAVSLDPESAEAHYVLGTMEQTVGHPEVAAEEYEEAASLEPDTARYILAKAEMLVWQQNADEAVQILRDASARMPGRPEIYAALGDVLSIQNRYGEAAGCFRVALRWRRARPTSRSGWPWRSSTTAPMPRPRRPWPTLCRRAARPCPAGSAACGPTV